ncbi:3-deoxy-manno-octulosonate cytidylyltransferase [Ruficoccus sp. ZRK36]|uniref:3-deoxy-manno-octulosonate cytidylyltransferase n=1 Tax=Ruficoccus sp. ZRK36 TaxID=2866311 RepID=UPI001C73B3E3|nr:3-deoxy-manno-octulosonate cytidylyltransferase [Ruficoccus sp. ZRK36]QYY36592.1 3-deoxy-manno-octulosonate cytidylyltransferase [Ruficoccus sp. ZRK36]
MSVSVIIPARLDSTRLPRKALLDLGGKPMLQHVWERASKMQKADSVAIATDSEEIRERAEGWGATVHMTSPECQSGTERLAELLPKIDSQFFLNVQGDEPFIEPALLDSLVQVWEDTGCDLVTAVFRIHDSVDIFDPNLVKVVRRADGQAMYFSRSPLPYVRGFSQENWIAEGPAFWAHIGVYGYARETLSRYTGLTPGVLEKSEKLEQLRFLEHGFSIQAVETAYEPLGIDTPDDLEAARRRL